jgi:hypothetical protein
VPGWIRLVDFPDRYELIEKTAIDDDALGSCAGLWSYILGDTVRFLARRPPRLLITGRLSYSLSAFGEHLTGEEIEAAVADAAVAVGAEVIDFAAGPQYPRKAEERNIGQKRIFAAKLDQGLSARNSDYHTHRSGGFGMAPPRVLAVSSGAFAAWMKGRGKLGGQHKVPRVIIDPALLSSLEGFMRDRRLPSGGWQPQQD